MVLKSKLFSFFNIPLDLLVALFLSSFFLEKNLRPKEVPLGYKKASWLSNRYRLQRRSPRQSTPCVINGVLFLSTFHQTYAMIYKTVK
jgi:hypothetical protein